MPQMGVSVSEGTITKWLKQPGETIAQDEPLLEISTDKVDTEVPSPGEGVVTEILVDEGQTVEVGTVLAVIAPAGCRGRGRTGSSRAAPAEAEPLRPEPTPEPAAASGARARRLQPRRLAPQALPSQAPAAASGNGRTFVSPVVARIAAEHGVDPSTVPGTGTGGRVTKKDILAFIESGARRSGGAPPRLHPPDAGRAAAPAAPAPAAPAAAPRAHRRPRSAGGPAPAGRGRSSR